jgi:hypothetical protein
MFQQLVSLNRTSGSVSGEIREIRGQERVKKLAQKQLLAMVAAVHCEGEHNGSCPSTGYH